jgi:hypothetical protein
MSLSRPSASSPTKERKKAQDIWSRLIDSLIHSSQFVLPLIKIIIEYVAPFNWLFVTDDGLCLSDPLSMKVLFDQPTVRYRKHLPHGRRICFVAKRMSDAKLYIMQNSLKPFIHRLDIDLESMMDQARGPDDVDWLKFTKITDLTIQTTMNFLAVSTGHNLFIRISTPSWVCFDLHTETWNESKSLLTPREYNQMYHTYRSAAAVGPCSFIMMEVGDSSAVWNNPICYSYDASGVVPIYTNIDIRHLIYSGIEYTISGRINDTIIFITSIMSVMLIRIKSELESKLEFHTPTIRLLPRDSFTIDSTRRYFICDSSLMLIVISQKSNVGDVYQLFLDSWNWNKIGSMANMTQFDQFVQI